MTKTNPVDKTKNKPAPKLDGPISLANAEQPPQDNAHVAERAEQFVIPVVSLEAARALPEAEYDAKASVYESDDPAHIWSFKATDGRTMRVVHLHGGLAAMPAKKPA